MAVDRFKAAIVEKSYFGGICLNGAASRPRRCAELIGAFKLLIGNPVMMVA